MKMQSKLKEIIYYQNLREAETDVKTFKSVHGGLEFVHNLAQISMNGKT